MTAATLPYSRREQRGWYFYDWANSAFFTTVVTVFLGAYITRLAQAAADPAGRIHPLGIPVDARSYWLYLDALSVISQVICLPVLGAMADYSPRKKTLFALFAYAGAAATIAMFFLRGSAYIAAGLLFLAANLTFGASVVIYNSYLPQIAAPEDRDAVSSKGWGIGYLGGGLLLALNLLLSMKAEALGLSEEMAVRINLASAGVWWAVFTIIPLVALRRRKPVLQMPPGAGYVQAGVRQVARTIVELRRYPQTLRFLIAYLLYNDAIQCVIVVAGPFGTEEIHMPMASIALLTLMIQFVAFFGSIGFDYVARAVGTKRAVMISLAIWSAVLVAAYGVKTSAQFFVLGGAVALVLGGSQALSRSLYSQMIPKGKEAEYFGIYEIGDKGTSWMAPVIFGLALQFTHSYHKGILSLIAFFVLGMLVLARVDVRRGAADAGQ